MYEGPAVGNADIISVYAIANGPAGMSPGKLAAQTFQAALLLAEAAAHDERLGHQLADWRDQGSRTVVRTAVTETVFARVCAEVPGVRFVDEGLAEGAQNRNRV